MSLDRLLKTKEVAHLTGMSTRWLAEHIKAGKFPKPDFPAASRGAPDRWLESTIQKARAPRVSKSRANVQAYPTPAGDYGLTIREHAYFQIMAAIIASSRTGSSVVLDVAAQAREYVDAGLDELAQEPRS